jgi:hypothetical protein
MVIEGAHQTAGPERRELADQPPLELVEDGLGERPVERSETGLESPAADRPPTVPILTEGDVDGLGAAVDMVTHLICDLEPLRSLPAAK